MIPYQSLNYFRSQVTINAGSPLQTFPFDTLGLTCIIPYARIIISPSNVTNVRINIGFYDAIPSYRSLFWATGSDTTQLTLPFPVRSDDATEWRFGIVNSSATNVELIAYYVLVYI